MNYAEEQAGEIEALLSIYEGDLEVVEENPYNVLTMPVRTENYDPDSDSPSGLFVLLRITHTPKYPDEKPKLMVEESDNMTEDDLEEFQNHLNEIMEESLGMVMVFTIISSSIEWLGSRWEHIQHSEEQEIKAKKEILDAEEKRKLEGTKVTLESFLDWKAKFDVEFFKAKAVKDPNKPTGREMFINNAALNESDIEFLTNAGETVCVDEALFDDLDDLDLDEDEDEDPDWNPDD